jgi:ferredoxin-NADP reductase/ferredoxin
MTVRVFVRKGCNGMGTCARLAPEVFHIGKDGLATVKVKDAEKYRDAVLRAARACPFVGVEIDGEEEKEEFTDVPVTGIRHLAREVLELRLGYQALQFTPGQYVFLRMQDKLGSFFRAYSVVEANDKEVTLCIRLMPNGRAGAALREASIGTMMGLSRPAGLFHIQTPDKPKLFVTGGTGIAPVIPMALAAPEAKKVIIFGARNEQDLFYIEELEALPNTKLIVTVQNPNDSWNGYVGSVIDQMEKRNVRAYGEIYACGSPGMIDAVRDLANRLDFPAERVYSDYFSPANTSGTQRLDAVGKNGSSPLVIQRNSAAASPNASSKTAPESAQGDDGNNSFAAQFVDYFRHFDPFIFLRDAHYYASIMVCTLIIFFAGSGFIANHTDWFHADSQPTIQGSQTIAFPETIANEEEDAQKIGAALFPEAKELVSVPSDDRPLFLVHGTDGSIKRAEINSAERQAVVVPMSSLDAGLKKDDDQAIIASLVGKYGGHFNDKSKEADEAKLAFDSESVWQYSNFVVYREPGVYAVTQTAAPLGKVISDLHRGKHANSLQSFIMDIAALALVVVAISGTVMGLQAVRRRRSAIILISLSSLALLYLLISR